MTIYFDPCGHTQPIQSSHKCRTGKSWDRMTMHRNRFLVNKTNKCTEFQFYWYYYSTCFGQPFCPSSGVLWYILCSCDEPATRSSSILLLVANSSSQLRKMYQSRCTAKISWWWAERLPETCRVVIPLKLEFSASVGFIHKEPVTMHGHMNCRHMTPHSTT